MALQLLARLERQASQPQVHQTLAQRILASFELSTFDAHEQDYLPENCIKEMVDYDAIKTELKMEATFPGEFNADVQHEFVRWICTEAQKIFAIAVQCDIGEQNLILSMLRFQFYGFNDTQLPMVNPKSGSTLLLPQVPEHFNNSSIWTALRLYNFYKEQWKYLVPVFSPSRYEYDLPSESIFPFTLQSGMPKVGAFSSVHRVKIHQAHQKHVGLGDVAIKEIKVSRGDDKTGTDNAWNFEARALAAINKLSHDHIVPCIAAIRRGDSRYFMFPWADGDSLRDFWDSAPKQTPTKEIVMQAIVQLRGLADALHSLHDFQGGYSQPNGRPNDRNIKDLNIPKMQVENENNEVDDYEDAPNQESIRHGDLKPENILRFLDRKSNLGILKIADMGLAKRHVVATQDRSHLTSTRYGTIRYEAPETMTALHGRSRLYDIWSMGCIALEFIIWILYGNDGLNNFYNQVKGGAQQVCQYFEIFEDEVPKRAEVHRVVLQWMTHIRTMDPECSQESAIQELLHVVRTKLLVVPLPPNRSSAMRPGSTLSPPGIGDEVTYYRATASQFRDALDEILSKVSRRPDYLLTGKARHNVKVPAPKSNASLGLPVRPRANVSANPHVSASSRYLTSEALSRPIRTDYTLPPLKDWEFPVDNDFAQKVLAQLGPQAFSPRIHSPGKLCSSCNELNFWAGGFSFEYKMSYMQEQAPFCKFCSILHGICTKMNLSLSRKVRFERNQSSLMMAESGPLPVLSIIRGPETQTPTQIQLGLPELLTPGSYQFFEILRLWLSDCDTHHQGCHNISPISLPTRLIDVGTVENPHIRLLETSEEAVLSSDYIALSHPWGDINEQPFFTTLRTDPSGDGHGIDDFKRTIPYDQLPVTFKNAVDSTRALQKRYLWIDSLCIIQGPNGDFHEESKKMEEVYSGAYCVLAASRATGQHDGFLGDRNQREYTTFQRRDEMPFYVCEPIDDFSQDILEGTLNRRGWVLQERALARRTIYFSHNQTYFECGNGVRCETLAKLHNNMADFLGDPNFPNKAMRSTSRGLKIEYFKDLYQQYSRLQFTRDEDRPFAIAGLEKRLQKAFKTVGGYGIFDDGPDGGLFHRSLLWQRGEDEPFMTPIVFPVERNIEVPSWSWMAYKGGIDYADPPFQAAEWEREEIRPPWTRKENEHVETVEQDLGMALKATVRTFDVKGRLPDEVRLIYDTDRTASDGQHSPRCVIIAKSRDGKTNREKRHYVLILSPITGMAARGERFFKRIGAGYMLGKYIKLGEPGILARIY